MADKQDRWLDRETAERLLRGESPDNAVDGPAREEAERLARTLGALSALSERSALSALSALSPSSAGSPGDDEELPGEAAALAAFRKAHADRTDLAFRAAPSAAADRAVPVGGAGQAARAEVFAADAGLVRIGGPVPASGRPTRWSRSVRLGLAAALAVGVAGGVAAASGTGLLPTPFGGAEPGRPGVSVSAPASPGRALVPPSPDASGTVGGGTAPATPDGGHRAVGGGTAGDGTTDDGVPVPPASPGAWPPGVIASCRELGSGRIPDAERRRALEHRAGGPKRVPAFCAGVLQGVGATSRGDDRGTGKGAAGRNAGKGRGDGGSKGGASGRGGPDGKSGRGDDGDDRGHGHPGVTRGNGGNTGHGGSGGGRGHHDGRHHDGRRPHGH
ncbi:hypothetical protein GCM10010269_41940 [Streptomyces humidus]|uniref:Extensin n=1 Tax=Streptomyces humidus TaxID=52259 RepID=A0A918FXX4_9ACTN|nr:hypothetical protein [Streptomyces humidus]GGR98733.1 hypothetical protein GCM10010269_41940 [Streptomyces humidus]